MSSVSADLLVLAFESSADQASAAVLCADGRHWQQIHVARHGHAAIITELAADVLAQAGITAAALTHVAAGRGPGSFTGIRVALAAAKGFALASGANGIGVSCLAARAKDARASGPDEAAGRLVATADTRRGSYFCQLFDPASDRELPILECLADSGQTLPDEWHGAAITGPGAAALGDAFPDHGMTVLPCLPPVDALQIARLAVHRLTAGLPLEPLTPLYVAPAFLGPPRARAPGS